jgi:hypothetical protein
MQTGFLRTSWPWRESVFLLTRFLYQAVSSLWSSSGASGFVGPGSRKPSLPSRPFGL